MSTTLTMTPVEATKYLDDARAYLATKTEAADAAKLALRAAILRIRPSGALTVDEMAEAVVRDRNYIDSVWSTYGETTKGKQTRVRVAAAEDSPLPPEYRELSDLATAHRNAVGARDDATVSRNSAVVQVYAAKILGPSQIAATVDIDRNHVGRLARAAGIEPLYRPGTRNQHTKSK